MPGLSHPVIDSLGPWVQLANPKSPSCLKPGWSHGFQAKLSQNITTQYGESSVKLCYVCIPWVPLPNKFKLIRLCSPSITNLHHQSLLCWKMRLFIPIWRITLIIVTCFHSIFTPHYSSRPLEAPPYVSLENVDFGPQNGHILAWG